MHTFYVSINAAATPGDRSGFSKYTLKKCNYGDLLRLAKFMGLQVGDHPSPGYLADLVSRATKR